MPASRKKKSGTLLADYDNWITSQLLRFLYMQSFFVLLLTPNKRCHTMQYIYENFTFPPDQSFTVRSDFLELKKFTTLKSHINYEIALIENCSGKRFIGDHIQDFEGTELVLLGSYLPHCWQ